MAVPSDRKLPLAGTPAGISPGGPSPLFRRSEAPERIGRYAITAELGRGGMGVVWRGHDPELGRDVAIKTILGAGRAGDSTSRERLLREARAAARLRHRAIVAVHEVGEDEAGHPFLVMDFVDGEPLDVLLDRARRERADREVPRVASDSAPASGPPASGADDDELAPRRIARVVREVALALDHAHRAGIIHRDVKPQNVLVSRDGRPHLVDFGLAQAGDETHLTRTGQLVGTPQFMAPEQTRGDRDAVGPATDVWGVGGILYSALTGSLPFQGSSVLELVHKIVTSDPPPPRRLDRTIHPDLETITLRCLEKDPARRYPSAGELAADLGRFLRGEAIAARPIGPLARALRMWRRHPARVAAVALGLVVAMGAPSAWMAVVAADARARERAAAEAQTRQVEAARAAADASWDAFDALDRDDAGGRATLSPEARRERLDARLAAGLDAFASAHRLQGVAPDDPAARATMFRAAMGYGDVATGAGQWNVATTAFRRALELGHEDAAARAGLERVEAERLRIAREHRSAVEDVLAEGRDGRLDRRDGGWEDALFTLLRYPEAQTVELLAAELDAASALLEDAAAQALLAAGPPDALELAAGEGEIEGLAVAVSERARLGAGGSLDRAFVDVLGRAHRRLETRAARMLRAEVRHRAPRFRAILGSAQEVAAGTSRLRTARLCCEALGRLGVTDARAVAALGRYLAAERDELRAAPAGIALCLIGGPDAARLVTEARGRFGVRGAFWGAVRRFSSRLIDDFADEASGDGPSDADALGHRGLLRLDAGDDEGAIDDLSRAIDLAPGDAHHRINRAVAHLRCGDVALARLDLDRAIELDPASAAAHANRGQIRGGQGDPAGARRDLDRAIELDPELATAWSQRANLRAEAGDLEGAIGDSDRAIDLAPHVAASWAARANARRKLGLYAEAERDVTRAIELDPRLARAYSIRGNVRRKLGKLDASVADLTRAVELDPGDAKAWSRRGKVRRKKGDLVGALADFLRATEEDPRFLDGPLGAALIHIDRNDLDAATTLLARVREQHPRNPDVGLHQATIARLRGDLDGALALLAEVLAIDPDLPLAFLERAQVRLERGERDAAIADLEAALTRSRSQADVDSIRAQLQRVRAGD